jgi:SAM-dependent methyltransferase
VKPTRLDDEQTSHYDSAYAAWADPISKFGGWANRFKFAPFLKDAVRLVDFGCGAGYLLMGLDVPEKLGIEINAAARERAAAQGIRTVADTDEVPDDWADVIISNSVLEHVLRPYDELVRLGAKVRPGGRLVFVVPHELRSRYAADDISQHLYTWSPASAGNLFRAAGFKVEHVDSIRHAWPPGYARIRTLLGSRGFHSVARVYGVAYRTRSIRVVAVRPGEPSASAPSTRSGQHARCAGLPR